MTTRRRTVRAAAATLAVIASAWAVTAQQPVPVPIPPLAVPAVGKPANAFTNAFTLPVDREARRLLQAAEDYLRKKEWRVACECLQTLLDAPEDTFVEVRGDAGRRVSVRTEANRALGAIPREGRETYQLLYGQAAEEKLAAARKSADPLLLAEVSQRFLHTKAGGEATRLLGTYHLDRGHDAMAALCFERLLGRPDADVSPAVLFRAALAFRRTGDAANANATWDRLTKTVGTGTLALGPKKFTAAELRREFDRDPRSAAFAADDWPLYRGNPARNATARGGSPYLEPLWASSLLHYEESTEPADTQAVAFVREQLLQPALVKLEGKPVLPTFFPVAAGGKLLARTYDGLCAFGLTRDPDADPPQQPGELLWIADGYNGLFKTARDLGKQGTLKAFYDQYFENNVGPMGVLFENALVGGVSHDHRRAYFVDDLAVPPHPRQLIQITLGGGTTNLGPFRDEALYFNRLIAVDLDSGKQVWELGGRGAGPANGDGPPLNAPKPTGAAATELLDSFFLGPPLPLGGKLYGLIERNTEIAAVCLDPNRGGPRGPELVWTQKLGTVDRRFPQDGLRRLQVAHLAYADGILVCPTNAGVVLGVDLLTHGLVWAYPYRDPNSQPGPDEQPVFNNPRLRIRMMPTMGVVAASTERWRPSAPCVTGGRVVFTAHDANKLHCVRLRDGEPLWTVPRKDGDLYLAGVFDNVVLVVGKSQCRGHAIDDGRELWRNDATGLPSGQGVAGDGIYYLPLAQSADPSREPGILALDVRTGKAVAPPTRSRRREVPGNLLFVGGELVSQTPRRLAAYPRLQQKLDEISRRLAGNPRDPVGLTERGELYLDKGELKPAVEDLRTALAQGPPPETRAKTRSKLFEAMTELAQRDFAAVDAYLDEYKALCTPDVAADADSAAKQKAAEEQRRRTADFLCLVGRGREQQGQMLDAFAAYEQFAALAGQPELVRVIDQPNTLSRPDVWSRGRIQGLLTMANAEQRHQLEAAIRGRFEAARAEAEPDALRRFVNLFGLASADGRAARLELAARLMATDKPEDLTEAERLLATLAYSANLKRDDPPAVARAIEALGRAAVRRGQFDAAAGYFRQLATDYPDVPVRDGHTGRYLYEDLFTDERFLPYLDAPPVSWGGPWRGRQSNGQYPPTGPALTLDPAGDAPPLLRRHRLVLEPTAGGGSWQLRLVDRATGEDRWKLPQLPAANYLFNQPVDPATFAFARGGVLVLHLGPLVCAIDLIERRELWRYNLFGRDASSYGNLAPDSDGGLLSISSDGKREKLGQVVVVESGYVCLQTRKGLVALDLTRPGPSVLWTAGDVTPRAKVFGDDAFVYVIEPGGGDKAVKALRAHDGVAAAVPDFSPTYGKRVRVSGRRILAAELTDSGDRRVRLYDVPTGENVWVREFPEDTVVMKSHDADLTGVVQPDGTAVILDAATGRDRLTVKLRDGHFKRLKDVHLLTDADHYYLAVEQSPQGRVEWSPASAGTIRAVKFNGPVYALRRGGGELAWVCDFLSHQAMLLEQWDDLPLLVFAAQYTRTGSDGQPDKQAVRVAAVERSTGKLVYDQEFSANHPPFYALRSKPAEGTIDLTRPDTRVTFQVLEQGK